jgi:hypothetical protein
VPVLSFPFQRNCGLIVVVLFAAENLFLYGNRLDGEIPTEMGQLSRMETFEVELNNITGPMPQEICKLTLLRTLEADCNGRVKCNCCTACFGEAIASDPMTEG